MRLNDLEGGKLMRSFTFKVPQNVVFGRGALKQLPDILQTGSYFSRPTGYVSDDA